MNLTDEQQARAERVKESAERYRDMIAEAERTLAGFCWVSFNQKDDVSFTVGLGWNAKSKNITLNGMDIHQCKFADRIAAVSDLRQVSGVQEQGVSLDEVQSGR